MNPTTQRLEQAFKDGYLVSFSNEHDECLQLWGHIAQTEGFPAVLVGPEPAGCLVSITVDEERDDHALILLRAGKHMAKAVRRHRGDSVVPLKKHSSLVAGPFPPAAAHALAWKLARLTGCAFPLEGYSEIVSAIKREAMGRENL